MAELKEAIIENVKALPFVSEVTQKDKEITIETKTSDDVRPQVSQAITNAGGVITSMKTEGQSLEDIFVKLVKTHEEGGQK